MVQLVTISKSIFKVWARYRYNT